MILMFDLLTAGQKEILCGLNMIPDKDSLSGNLKFNKENSLLAIKDLI